MGTQGTHLQTEWILKSWLTPCPSANGYTRYTSAERMASFLCCHSISIMWLTQRAEAMVPCRCYPTKLPPFQREPSRTADLQIFAKQTTYGDPGRGMGWEVRNLSRGFPWILQGSSNDIKTRRSTTTAPPTVVGMCAGKSVLFPGPTIQMRYSACFSTATPAYSACFWQVEETSRFVGLHLDWKSIVISGSRCTHIPSRP